MITMFHIYTIYTKKKEIKRKASKFQKFIAYRYTEIVQYGIEILEKAIRGCVYNSRISRIILNNLTNFKY